MKKKEFNQMIALKKNAKTWWHRLTGSSCLHLGWLRTTKRSFNQGNNSGKVNLKSTWNVWTNIFSSWNVPMLSALILCSRIPSAKSSPRGCSFSWLRTLSTTCAVWRRFSCQKRTHLIFKTSIGLRLLGQKRTQTSSRMSREMRRNGWGVCQITMSECKFLGH